MSKKKQNKKKKQTVVSVEVNKNKSNKALESFVKASLGALLSFGLACTANLSFNFGDNISETSSEKASENVSDWCQKKYFIRTKTKNGYVIVCSDDKVNIHSDGSVSFSKES